MRKKDINGILYDILDLRNWETPLNYFSIPYKVEINLLTGKLNVVEEDNVTNLLKEKRKWFKERVRKLKGRLSDFEKAKIIIFGAKEKIEINFKDTEFKKERIFDSVY